MDTKQTLATLIDAYADAKRSGNETLIKMATTQLQEFFSAHDVTPTVPVAPAVVEAPGDTED
jgi:hypothetical protein